MNTIIPITEDNLEQAADASAKFGMPRSAGWLRRCLFDPTVEDLTTDKIRGHMSVDENGDVKAMQCYYYQPCFFLQTKILGGTGAIMGAEAKYGEELLCVLDKDKETKTESQLSIANCVFGERSYKINKKISRMKESPYRPSEYRVCAIDWAAWPLVILNRLHLRMDCLQKAIFLIMRPLFRFRLYLHHVTGTGKCGYSVVQHGNFGDPRFKDFWERFLAANDGIISSREPRRLQWLFDESIKAGKVLLATAEKEGRIDGYVLLRERGVGGPAPRSYDIIDICAIGNDTNCLKTLVREAAWLAGRNGGVRVYFEGGMPKQEEWLDDIFSYHRKNRFYTMYKAKDSSVRDALEQNKGWFFGPLDGERCMGHGGYIDL